MSSRALRAGSSPVYGKTGTVERPGQPDQSWYACYVPHPSRPIVVVVTVEKGGFGAETAAPAARLILSNWFDLGKDKFKPGQLRHAMSASSTIQPASEPPAPLVPREWRLRLDPLLLLATLGIVACSLIAIKGATADDVAGQPYYYLERQAVYAGRRDRCSMYGVSRLDYSRLRELKYVTYGLLIGSILLVFALATATRGSKRWIELPFFRFQPSELGKLLLVIALSGFIVDRMRRMGREVTARIMLLALLPAMLVMAQPDLGTVARLRRRRARAAVRRGGAVAPLRGAGGARRGVDHARPRRRAGDGRRGPQAVPGAAPDGVPQPLGRSGGRRLPAAAVADRHRIRREDRAAASRTPRRPG